jgi:hypothetical protein
MPQRAQDLKQTTVMKPSGFFAALAALTLVGSTASAAGIDLGNALGPSGGYTNQAYYQGTLSGQPMTADEQTYADQEDQLRQMGFQAELGGDFAQGQMFYQIAYGLTPGSPMPDWFGGVWGSGLLSSSDPPGGGFGPREWNGAGSWSSSGSVLTLSNPGDLSAISVFAPVPEASTWAMMLIGFTGLGCAAYGRRRALVRA